MNLFIEYFKQEGSIARQNEYKHCLSKNLTHPDIKEVYVLTSVHPFPIRDIKLTIVPIDSRVTYAAFFEKIRKYTNKDDINIVANADIYFDGTLAKAKNITEKEVYCLSRYNYKEDGSCSLVPWSDSTQDAWIFRGHTQNVDGNFFMGIPNCDNRIAYEFDQAGYKVSNPSLSIRAIHFHLSNVRNYKDYETVGGNKKYIDPCSL